MRGDRYFGWLLVVGVFVAGCATVPIPEPEWPANAPARGYFVQVYDADSTNGVTQPRDEYLEWVRQFYEGTDRYPVGWAEFERTLVSDFDPSLQAEAAERLRRLGGKVAADWAKHNSLRLVTSPMLLIWSQVIQEAVASGLGVAALKMIEQDVDALLDGRLPPEEIGVERYAAWLPELT